MSRCGVRSSVAGAECHVISIACVTSSKLTGIRYLGLVLESAMACLPSQRGARTWLAIQFYLSHHKHCCFVLLTGCQTTHQGIMKVTQVSPIKLHSCQSLWEVLDFCWQPMIALVLSYQRTSWHSSPVGQTRPTRASIWPSFHALQDWEVGRLQ
jgi:hypothetical protein